MERAGRSRAWLWASAGLVVGCAGGDPHTDVVRLPDPVPLRTADPLAASSADPAETAAPVESAPPKAKRVSRAGGDERKGAADADARERAREVFKEGVAL